RNRRIRRTNDNLPFVPKLSESGRFPQQTRYPPPLPSLPVFPSAPEYPSARKNQIYPYPPSVLQDFLFGWKNRISRRNPPPGSGYSTFWYPDRFLHPILRRNRQPELPSQSFRSPGR